MTRAPSKRDRIPEILERLTAGESLRSICDNDDTMPGVQTVLDWANADAEFGGQYARARETGIHMLAQETLAIADRDDLDANDKRVRIDARKWFASKMLPKVYGDRQQVDVVSHDMSEADIDAALQRRLGSAATR